MLNDLVAIVVVVESVKKSLSELVIRSLFEGDPPCLGFFFGGGRGRRGDSKTPLTDLINILNPKNVVGFKI